MSLMQAYSIGQLARAASVPVSTLRYYERLGLLRPDSRTGGNYRSYRPQSLERLKFILSSRDMGLSLDDIDGLLALTFSPENACADVLELMRKRLTEIRQRIGELRRLEKTLARSLQVCCTGGGPDLCSEVTRIQQISPLSQRSPRSPRTRA